MSQGDPGFRNISNNHFGDNVTIHQGDVHNHASDQASQCLKDLRSTDPRDDKVRIQNTKGGLLKDSYRWILEHETFKDWRDNAENRILWIKGDPGKGKTMLLCGIIDELMPMTKLAQPNGQTTSAVLMSYFFCQGTDGRINNATAVLRGLIYLIIAQEPSLISHVQEKYKHAGKDLFSDANAWVALSEIFAAILQDSKVKEVILVIDALDECEADLSRLLDTIVQQFEFSHIKCIVSSRNILGIQQRLESYIPQGILSLELKGNASCVSEAVDAYIKHSISCLTSIQDDHGVQEDLHRLVQQKANGTFLWVSLVMKELEEAQSWEVMEVVADMPTDLAALYNRMMHQINSLMRRNKRLCKNLLSAIFTAYYPLSLAEVGVVAGIPDQISEDPKSIAKLVTMCGSFLTLNEDKVYFIHQSAKDFLSTEIHSADAAQRHLELFKQSITAISKLPKNIYGLTDFGPRPEDAQPPDPNPLASMRYSCFYWANHLCETCAANTKDEAQVIINETLEPFLNNYILRWIESLCLLDGLLEGLRSIRKLLHELPRNGNTQLSSILSSIEIFVLRNGPVIDKSPLQVYGSALLFSPVDGHIKTTHWNERLSFIKAIEGIKKDGFLQTLEGHTEDVEALAFSSSGETLASLSGDETLRFWDVATGALKWTVPCLDTRASAIAFSPDNRTLLLATCGDPMVGRNAKEDEKEMAKSDDYWITYITLSPTSGMPETSRGNRVVRLNWPHLLSEHRLDICAFAFSSDCKTLASGSENGWIQLWDASTGLLRQAIKSHDRFVRAIAILPDGSKLASAGLSFPRIRLWDAATGALLEDFDWQLDLPRSIMFFQDGKKLLFGDVVCDPTTNSIGRTSIDRLEEYDGLTAISPDNKIMASASVEIRLWDATIIQWENDSDCHASFETSFAFSTDGTTVARANSNRVQIWDVATGECRRTIEDYWPDVETWQVNGGCFAYTAIAFSVNGKTLALGSLYKNSSTDLTDSYQIQLWETVAGDCIYRKTLPGKWNWVSAAAFSPDGTTLAVGFGNGRIRLLDIVADRWLWEMQPKYDDPQGPDCFAFSPDSSMLASAHVSRFKNKTCGLSFWDAATGSHRRTFAVDIPNKKTCGSIMFSPDGQYLCMDNQYEMRLFQEGQDEHGDERILTLDAYLSKNMQGQGIPVTDGWITKDGRRLLWVPKEYRFRTPSAFVYGNTVVLGYRSGVTFIWLDL